MTFETVATRADPPDRHQPSRPLTLWIGKKLRPWFNRAIARFSTVPNAPLLDPSWFPWMAELQGDWRRIRAEAERILSERDAVPLLNEISPDHARIAGDQKWRSFFLHGYGYRIAENCARAPQTAAALADVPGLNSAFFSILAPGAHIPRHRGVTKGLITAHLGLIVPAEAELCHMRVADHSAHWRLGEWLVFDDSQHHEVWNATEETRVVLLIQFVRPARFPGSLIAGLFLAGIRRSAFIQDARRNLRAWQQGDATPRGRLGM